MSVPTMSPPEWLRRLRAANELEAKILELGADKVAAFIAETVDGATLGAVPAAPAPAPATIIGNCQLVIPGSGVKAGV